DIALVDMMQKANARLREERERTRELAAQRLDLVERSNVLFHELQHRVSNNLMMVAALLSVQRRAIADEPAKQVLDNAVHR
ncbi:histidine kinase dimerization/phosphoacceptor domain -containing protein, partial [Clostridium perfringens]